jgi:hypothetical protein
VSFVRDRSYEVRESIATAIGAPLHTDFTVPATFNVSVLFSDDDNVEARLLSTSNAGFRGIEGWFVREDGTKFTTSLGEVSEWTAYPIEAPK